MSQDELFTLYLLGNKAPLTRLSSPSYSFSSQRFSVRYQRDPVIRLMKPRVQYQETTVVLHPFRLFPE